MKTQIRFLALLFTSIFVSGQTTKSAQKRKEPLQQTPQIAGLEKTEEKQADHLEPGYGPTSWGMTSEQVKSVYPSFNFEVVSNEANPNTFLLRSKTELFGKKEWKIIFDFESNKLKKVTLSVILPNNDNLTYPDEVFEQLIKKYNTPASKNHIAFAHSTEAIWSTERMSVQFKYSPISDFMMITIQYEPKTSSVVDF
jgi:hypothetical protein